MTKQEFLQKLSETKNNFKWEINSSYELRGWKDGQTFCPITAVILIENGVYVPSNFADKARIYLNMDMRDIESIMQTADGMQFGCNKRLRNEMKAALGLEN